MVLDTYDRMEFVERALGSSPEEAFKVSGLSNNKERFVLMDLPKETDPYDFAANRITDIGNSLNILESSMSNEIQDAYDEYVRKTAYCLDITGTTHGLTDERSNGDRVFLFFGWEWY